MASNRYATHRRPSFWGAFLLIAALCGLHAPPSLAVAMYFSSATAELTIIDIAGATGVPCSICTDAFGDTFPIGNASGSSTGFVTINGDPANLTTGDGVSLKAEASGSASAIGALDGFFNAFAVIDFTNSGASEITLTFRVVFSLLANASITNPASEDAFTGADIAVETSSGVYFQEVVSDVLFGPFGPQSLSDDFTFSITLAAGGGTDFIDISVAADGAAAAFADVPEPGVLPLLALGLAGLGFFARRRKLC